LCIRLRRFECRFSPPPNPATPPFQPPLTTVPCTHLPASPKGGLQEVAAHPLLPS
jgi:hypothetical protein